MRLLLSLLALSAAAARAALLYSPADFHLLSAVRSVDLASGSLARIQDIHVVRLPAARQRDSTHAELDYFLALSAAEAAQLSFFECLAKSGGGLQASDRAVLQPERVVGASLPGSQLFRVALPARFFAQQHDTVDAPDVTLTCASVVLHQAAPLPREVAQKEDMFLHWRGDSAPRTLYGADKGRVKVRVPHPRILSFANSGGAEATKSGTTITFGPYESIAPLAPGAELSVGSVHYLHDSPVISLVDAERHVEISHWGDNAAVEDRLWLRNDGPQLKGHFSRIDHQMSSFYTKDNSHVLNSLVMHLPAGAKDAYYLDQIGNISTSHFRPSPPSPPHSFTSTHLLPSNRASSLDLNPRYPLLGGWNFTFSVGFNLGLSEGGWGKHLGGAKYSVAIPFLTPITDVAVDMARTRIVLPEGASDISVSLPFSVDSETHGLYTTYLDSTGRPCVLLERARCSDQHGGNVIVRYSYSPAAHARKPVVIGLIALAAFTAAMVGRRVESKIGA